LANTCEVFLIHRPRHRVPDEDGSDLPAAIAVPAEDPEHGMSIVLLALDGVSGWAVLIHGYERVRRLRKTSEQFRVNAVES
jgi:hypothetical protein